MQQVINITCTATISPYFHILTSSFVTISIACILLEGTLRPIIGKEGHQCYQGGGLRRGGADIDSNHDK